MLDVDVGHYKVTVDLELEPHRVYRLHGNAIDENGVSIITNEVKISK